MVISKTDERCLNCENFDTCDNKRMVMCAMAELPQRKSHLEKATETVSMPIANDLCVKHDYRQIKIAPNTTVTIDLEEAKKKLQEELTKHLRCDFLQNGS